VKNLKSLCLVHLSFFSVLVFASIAFAEEIVMLPPTELKYECPDMLENEFDQHECHEMWFPNPDGTNWKSPVNISDGTWHIRYIVRKITKSVTTMILYYWDNKGSRHGNVGPGSAKPRLNTEGEVIYGTGNPADGWHSDPYNPTNVSTKFRIQLRDGNSLQFKSGDALHAYFPLHFHATIVAVPVGETFSGWENYPVDGATISRKPHNTIQSSTSFKIIKGHSNNLEISELNGEASRVDIIACNGKVVSRYSAYEKNSLTIPAENFAQGIYAIKVIGRNGRVASRLIAY
jgi:hypothetical protein